MAISTRQQLYNSLQEQAQHTQIPTRLHNFTKKTLLDDIGITLSSMSPKIQEWLQGRGMSDYRNVSIQDVKNMVMYIVYQKTYRMTNEINILNEIIDIIDAYELRKVGIVSKDCLQSFQGRMKDTIDKNIAKANRKKEVGKGKISNKNEKKPRRKVDSGSLKKSRKYTETSSDEEEDEVQEHTSKKKKGNKRRSSVKDVSALKSENKQLKSAVESLKNQISDLVDEKAVLRKRVTKQKSISKKKRELSSLNDTPEYRR